MLKNDVQKLLMRGNACCFPDEGSDGEGGNWLEFEHDDYRGKMLIEIDNSRDGFLITATDPSDKFFVCLIKEDGELWVDYDNTFHIPKSAVWDCVKDAVY